MTDRITFNCADCGHIVSIEKGNPPNDDNILSCFGCGREFGPYRTVKAAMIESAKAEIDKLTERTFGKGIKPKWRG